MERDACSINLHMAIYIVLTLRFRKMHESLIFFFEFVQSYK